MIPSMLLQLRQCTHLEGSPTHHTTSNLLQASLQIFIWLCCVARARSILNTWPCNSTQEHKPVQHSAINGANIWQQVLGPLVAGLQCSVMHGDRSAVLTCSVTANLLCQGPRLPCSLQGPRPPYRVALVPAPWPPSSAETGGVNRYGCGEQGHGLPHLQGQEV